MKLDLFGNFVFTCLECLKTKGDIKPFSRQKSFLFFFSVKKFHMIV